MKATVIVDNIKNGEIAAEWGLAVFIEYNGKKILLDTGASDLFVENSKKLCLPLEEVDAAVLSHAHYDHANGMEAFFRLNDKAKFYVQKSCSDNCYAKRWIFRKYIGIPRGIIERCGDRIKQVDGKFTVCEGVSIIPHTTAGLETIGKREGMYLKTPQGLVVDDFSHEQSLVFETAEGLVIFNSCSHGGAANIINEVSAAYPDKKVRALFGGFHLYNKTEKEVREFARKVRETGIEHLYTGHCTGEKAFRILREELGDRVEQFRSGFVMEF